MGVRSSAICFLILWFPLSAYPQEKNPETPQQVRHQVTGLFLPERVQDLREVCSKLPNIRLLEVDYPKAEAVFEYVPGQAFPGAKPEQVVERFDQVLRQATRSTFGIKPLPTMPPEKLLRIEIPVAGLDCKACSLAAYEAVYRLDGVERATADFRVGLVTAVVDPSKTDRQTLEAALKKRGVEIGSRK